MNHQKSVHPINPKTHLPCALTELYKLWLCHMGWNDKKEDPQ